MLSTTNRGWYACPCRYMGQCHRVKRGGGIVWKQTNKKQKPHSSGAGCCHGKVKTEVGRPGVWGPRSPPGDWSPDVQLWRLRAYTGRADLSPRPPSQTPRRAVLQQGSGERLQTQMLTVWRLLFAGNTGLWVLSETLAFLDLGLLLCERCTLQTLSYCTSPTLNSVCLFLPGLPLCWQ